ncbi:gamma-aminobutyric acid receptor subunit beta-3-like isoform X2 [Antedon mediterranea]|uniref:gamma-aminobutyric acid receptor subunit beta-3-like isoform X2 n=1 Tax=Antedon mediterranea TaxID=105859 RepID=UPI003AF96CB8
MWLANHMMFIYTLSAHILQTSALSTVDVGNGRKIVNITHLMKGYDIRLRPDFGGPAVMVGVDMEIASINSFSEVNMEYTITMYFRQYWQDKRLQYTKELGNISLDGRQADNIWVPDTYFVNDKRSFVHDITVKNRLIRLHYDGTILYGLRITTVASCMMDLQHYPMDEQNCTLEIESYGYTTEDIMYRWEYGDNSIEGTENIDMAQFTLVDYSVQAKVQNFSTGDYSRLSIAFQMRRNIGSHALQTFLPCTLIVILSWVAFWINHEATAARVALGITTVLTMTTISVRQTLPRISYIKAIDIYLVTCFAFVFAALLEYALVNFSYWSLQKKKKQQEKTKILPNPRSTYYSYYTEIPTNQSVGKRLSQQQDEEEESGFHVDTLNGLDGPSRTPTLGLKHRRKTSLDGRRTNHNIVYCPRKINNPIKRNKRRPRIRVPGIKDVNIIDKWARILFPCIFITFNIMYWSFYLLLK